MANGPDEVEVCIALMDRRVQWIERSSGRVIARCCVFMFRGWGGQEGREGKGR